MAARSAGRGLVSRWAAARTFGASGRLKDRLPGGERADVFASANTEHPQARARAGRAA